MSFFCPPLIPPPFTCPTLEQCRDALLKLLPLGRAWQSHEGGPRARLVSEFEDDDFEVEGFDADGDQTGSILWQFCAAIAHLFYFANTRLCELREEFWCASHKETHDEWMAEYGLPDACDPWPDLCAKVAALGGATCAYLQAVA